MYVLNIDNYVKIIIFDNQERMYHHILNSRKLLEFFTFFKIRNYRLIYWIIWGFPK